MNAFQAHSLLYLFVNIFSYHNCIITTNPTASTTASMESTLIENTARYITKNIPISEIGITNVGMSVMRQSLRKTKITKITNKKAMTTVVCTSTNRTYEACVIESEIQLHVFGQIFLHLLYT